VSIGATRVLSNQASFALRVRVIPAEGQPLPSSLFLKATLVAAGARKATLDSAPHLLVPESAEAPLLLDAPPGRHLRASLLPAAPVAVVPDQTGGGGTAHFSLRLGDGALSDRCGAGRSLLKLLITPALATPADIEALCDPEDALLGLPRLCSAFTAPFRAITRLRTLPSMLHIPPPARAKPSGSSAADPRC